MNTRASGEKAPVALLVKRASEVYAEADYEAQPAKDLGITPSGGSKLQQSSSCVIYGILVFTIALLAAVIYMNFLVQDLFDQQLLRLEQAERNLADPASKDKINALLLVYFKTLSTGEIKEETACDYIFFVNKTKESNESGLTLLVDAYETLDTAVFVFLILGTLAAALLAFTKCCTSVKLTLETNQEENDVQGTDTQNVISNSLVLVRGRFETRQQRRTRLYFRSEMIVYVLVHAFQDVPLLSFVITFYLISTSRRGAPCALCFDEGRICSVDALGSLPVAFTVTLALVITSLVWHAASLGERWVAWVRYKKRLVQEKPNYIWISFYIIAGTVIYAFAVISPILLLFSSRVGTTFLDINIDGEGSFFLIGLIGMTVWFLNALWIFLTAGIDPGQACAFVELGCDVLDTCCNFPGTQTCALF